MFEVSPAQSAEREASEAEAVRNELQTLNEFLEMKTRKISGVADGCDSGYAAMWAQFALAEIERNKDSLGASIVATQKDFADRRAELDRLEKAAIAEMLAEDSEYQKSAGERLERDIVLAGADHSVPFEDQVEMDDADSDSGPSELDDSASQATLEQSKGMPADHDVEFL
ncbi:hypothetical protein AC578_9598 [Pseudocercospora eumusae]|uniref:Uncharacterized protein n=1 Tax=Pseudocercospora eumusae TaxID=321146 RepID=A0A139GXY3_9PEZI|nr:hypothetical protein AC578_9598 [Pseudocercospora eumusae]